MSGILTSVLGKYFEVFFKNFKTEDFDIDIFAGTGTLKNLEVNEVIVQELLDFPYLQVKRVFVNLLQIKASITNIRRDPVVISIDCIDCVLVEPPQPMRKTNKLNEIFELDKFKPNGYGISERIADGISININSVRVSIEFLPPRVLLPHQQGKSSSSSSSSSSTNVKKSTSLSKVKAITPPKLVIRLEKISIATVSAQWMRVDLKTCRDFNDNKKFIYVFKECNVASVSTSFLTLAEDGSKSITPLITNLPIQLRITMKKEQNNNLIGLQLDMEIRQLKLIFNIEQLSLISCFSDAFVLALAKPLPPSSRNTKAAAPKRKAHEMTMLFNLLLNSWNIKLELPQKSEKDNTSGLEFMGNELEVASAPMVRGEPINMKEFQLMLAFFSLRQYSFSPPPESACRHHTILQPRMSPVPIPASSMMTCLNSRSVYPLKDPRAEFTAHMTPLLALRTRQRNPPQQPLPDLEAQLLLNPIEIIIEAEVVKQLHLLQTVIEKVSQNRAEQSGSAVPSTQQPQPTTTTTTSNSRSVTPSVPTRHHPSSSSSSSGALPKMDSAEILEEELGEEDGDVSFIEVALLDKTFVLHIQLVDLVVVVPSINFPNVLHVHLSDLQLKTDPRLQERVQGQTALQHLSGSTFPSTSHDLATINQAGNRRRKYVRTVVMELTVQLDVKVLPRSELDTPEVEMSAASVFRMDLVQIAIHLYFGDLSKLEHQMIKHHQNPELVNKLQDRFKRTLEFAELTVNVGYMGSSLEHLQYVVLLDMVAEWRSLVVMLLGAGVRNGSEEEGEKKNDQKGGIADKHEKNTRTNSLTPSGDLLSASEGDASEKQKSGRNTPILVILQLRKVQAKLLKRPLAAVGDASLSLWNVKAGHSLPSSSSSACIEIPIADVVLDGVNVVFELQGSSPERNETIHGNNSKHTVAKFALESIRVYSPLDTSVALKDATERWLKRDKEAVVKTSVIEHDYHPSLLLHTPLNRSNESDGLSPSTFTPFVRLRMELESEYSILKSENLASEKSDIEDIEGASTVRATYTGSLKSQVGEMRLGLRIDAIYNVLQFLFPERQSRKDRKKLQEAQMKLDLEQEEQRRQKLRSEKAMLQLMAMQMDQQDREREEEIERVQQEEEMEKRREQQEREKAEREEEARNQARLKKDVHLHTLQSETRPMGFLDGVIPNLPKSNTPNTTTANLAVSNQPRRSPSTPSAAMSGYARVSDQPPAPVTPKSASGATSLLPPAPPQRVSVSQGNVGHAGAGEERSFYNAFSSTLSRWMQPAGPKTVLTTPQGLRPEPASVPAKEKAASMAGNASATIAPESLLGSASQFDDPPVEDLADILGSDLGEEEDESDDTADGNVEEDKALLDGDWVNSLSSSSTSTSSPTSTLDLSAIPSSSTVADSSHQDDVFGLLLPTSTAPENSQLLPDLVIPTFSNEVIPTESLVLSTSEGPSGYSTPQPESAMISTDINETAKGFDSEKLPAIIPEKQDETISALAATYPGELGNDTVDINEHVVGVDGALLKSFDGDDSKDLETEEGSTTVLHMDWEVAMKAIHVIAYPSWKSTTSKWESGTGSGSESANPLSASQMLASDNNADELASQSGALELAISEINSVKSKVSDNIKKVTLGVGSINGFAILGTTGAAPERTQLLQPIGLTATVTQSRSRKGRPWKNDLAVRVDPLIVQLLAKHQEVLLAVLRQFDINDFKMLTQVGGEAGMEDGEEEEDEDGVAKSQKVQKKSVSAIAYDEMKKQTRELLLQHFKVIEGAVAGASADLDTLKWKLRENAIHTDLLVKENSQTIGQTASTRNKGEAYSGSATAEPNIEGVITTRGDQIQREDFVIMDNTPRRIANDGATSSSDSSHRSTSTSLSSLSALVSVSTETSREFAMKWVELAGKHLVIHVGEASDSAVEMDIYLQTDLIISSSPNIEDVHCVVISEKSDAVSRGDADKLTLSSGNSVCSLRFENDIAFEKWMNQLISSQVADGSPSRTYVSDETYGDDNENAASGSQSNFLDDREQEGESAEGGVKMKADTQEGKRTSEEKLEEYVRSVNVQLSDINRALHHLQNDYLMKMDVFVFSDDLKLRREVFELQAKLLKEEREKAEMAEYYRGLDEKIKKLEKEVEDEKKKRAELKGKHRALQEKARQQLEEYKKAVLAPTKAAPQATRSPAKVLPPARSHGAPVPHGGREHQAQPRSRGPLG